MKLCVTCKIKKKNSAFSKHNNAKDKLQSSCKVCVSTYNKGLNSTKEGFLSNALGSAKNRARKKQVAFELDAEYLNSIVTDKCPVFNVELKYACSQKGSGNADPHTASLDRVIPELGYVKGNVVFISNCANVIKSDATEVQLYAVADWLHDKRKEVLNAFKEQITQLPEGSYIQGAVGAELGSVSTPWTWEDDDDPHHHCGTIRGEDVNHRAQESSGDGMGCRGEKVATLVALTRLEDNGEPDAEIVRLNFKGRYLLD